MSTSFKKSLFTLVFLLTCVAAIFTATVVMLPREQADGVLGASTTLTAPQGGTGLGVYTRGDMIYATSTNSFSKLGIGSTGQVLTTSGGLPTWQNGIKPTCATVGTANADYITDGVADQTEINQAITYCNGLGGGTVFIKKPTTRYFLAGNIIPKSNVDIVVEEGVWFDWDSTSFSAFYSSSTVTNVNFYGGSFDGNAGGITGTIPNEYHAIYFANGSHDVHISHVYAFDIASGAIRFRDSSYDFTVDDLIAESTDNAVIVSVGCSRFTLKNIKVIDTFAEGIYLEQVHDFLIDDVYFTGCARECLALSNLNTGLNSQRGSFTNITAASGTLSGISIRGLDGGLFDNVYSYGNKRDGVLVDASTEIKMNNVYGLNNNQEVLTDGAAQYAAVRLFDTIRADLVNVDGIDTQASATQYYSIRAYGTSDYISIVGGRSEGNINTSNPVAIGGNNSRTLDHFGYNPHILKALGNVSASPSINIKNGDVQTMTLTNATTTFSTFSTVAPQGQLLTLHILQDATGGRRAVWPSNVVFKDGSQTSPLSTSANAVDILVFQLRSSQWYEISHATEDGEANLTWINATGTNTTSTNLAVTGTGTTTFGGAVSTTACLVADGSAASPSMSLASTSTGWYADKTSNPYGFGITVGGNQVMSMTSTGTRLMSGAGTATDKTLAFTDPDYTKNILGSAGLDPTTYAGWARISSSNFGFRQFGLSLTDSDAYNMVGFVGATSVSTGFPMTLSAIKWDGGTGSVKLNNNENVFRINNGLSGSVSTLMTMTSSGTIMGTSGSPSSTLQVIAPAGATNGGFMIGASSTANAVVRVTNVPGKSSSLDFGATAANSYEDLTISVPGAVDGDVCSRGAPNALASAANTTITCFVSSADTVTVRRVCNEPSSACSDPAAATVWVKVEHLAN